MSSPDSIPPLVSKALKNGGELAFLSSTLNASGRLFATLAASARGVIGEYGTGAGVGAAWLRYGAPKDRRVITFEPSEELHQRACETFVGEDINVVLGGWKKVVHEGPYGLLHISLRNLNGLDPDEIAAAIEPRGILIIDDFVPSHDWPPRDLNGVDYVRQSWLLDPRFMAVDVAVAEDVAVLIATKI